METLSSMLSAMEHARPKPGPGNYRGDDGLLRCKKCDAPIECVVNVNGKDVTMPCACKCESIKRERREMEERRLRGERETKRRREQCFVAGRSSLKTFEGDDGRFGHEQMDLCRRYSQRFELGVPDYGLLLFGPPDSGKTFMSCCVANDLLDRGFSVVMRSMPQIIQQMQGESYGSKAAFRDMLQNCDLLVLDDLGAERSTSYGQEVVYAIVDGRYQSGKPMIVSTNLTRKELAYPSDVMSQRIYGRLLEVCLPVEVDTGRRRSTRDGYDRMRADLGI